MQGVEDYHGTETDLQDDLIAECRHCHRDTQIHGVSGQHLEQDWNAVAVAVFASSQ